jgi:putative ABC transport system ATP-binding protein
MIRFEKVTKTYPTGDGLTVLHGIDLHVCPHEYVGILGPSGSGKSTLLHMMGLLDKPTTGAVYLKDKDICSLTDNELSVVRGKSIGFVFQSFYLISQLSILENVELPLFYQKIPRHERRKKALTVLKDVGLEHRTSHLPTQLSGGECQRAAIARALVTNPYILLADEPTGNLDSRTGREIIALFDKLHDNGRTIVMITHDQSIADNLPRVMYIYDGRMYDKKPTGRNAK